MYSGGGACRFDSPLAALILPRFLEAEFRPEALRGPEGGDSENAGRARQGRRVVRKRHEALQEAVREGWHPERDQEARALREAVCQAQEEGAGGKEARAEEGAKGDDVTFRSASPPFVPGPARVRGGAFDRERNARRPDCRGHEERRTRKGRATSGHDPHA